MDRLPKGFDRHHLIFTKRVHETYPESKFLRETQSLIPVLPRELHEEIHEECSEVPLLNYHVLRRTVALFEPDDTNTLQSMENLAHSISEASRHYKTKPLERELADIAIESIMSQRAFVEEVYGKA